MIAPVRLFAALAVLLTALALASPALADDKDTKAPAEKELDKDHAAKMARGLDLFKQHVRPVLVEQCLRCHGGKKTEAGFDLSERDRLLKGGEAGPAILVGRARDSLLFKMIAHQKEPYMPEGGKQLSAEIVGRFGEWIDNGAPYDSSLIVRKDEKAWTSKVVATEAKQHWAFQPLKRVDPPTVKDAAWCKTPIDRFIRAAQETAGVTPNPPAERRRLIRRVYFDLIGLPPTPEEVEAFVNDKDPEAYPKLLDRLLDNPHYGERWARHWLDLARFAESHGFEHDYDRPSAYHYRDFVIKALNQGMPYDRFVKWQIAGDEYAPDDLLALTATGFLAAGVHSTQITANEAERHRYDETDDQLATIGTAMLGLTVGCARCHDHKFDPIPQRDYYRLLATFTTTVRSEIDLKLETPAPAKPATVKALICSEGVPALRLHTQGTDFYPETYFLRRGDTNQKDGVAGQGFLQVLMPTAEGAKKWQSAPPAGGHTSYRRHAFAEWLTDVEGGAGNLLARVIVNRLWQRHLGRGIVATVSDFGVRGEAPTHPELLDWLATELVREGWKLKPIHKRIMTSAVYLEDSTLDETKVTKDRDNRLYWRHPVRRLEGEVIRDSLLALGGPLDERMYGPGTLDEAMKRRSIYFTVKRSKLIPMLAVFDAPEALGSIGERPTTTIAPQALYLLNNPQVRACARGFAQRIAPDAKTSGAEAIRRAYLAALGRQPTVVELNEGEEFLRAQTASYETARKADGRTLALTDLCQTLLCLNEFVYLE